jgi:hypothetical protein
MCSMCESTRVADARTRDRHEPPTSSNSAWAASSSLLAKLVTGLAKPATTVFNGALVGVFAVVGASVGAVAGAVAARATSRGVVRGAGVGAVAGAAVSVEALDLARLCLSGYSVAGAMERRETRLALLFRDAEGRVVRRNDGGRVATRGDVTTTAAADARRPAAPTAVFTSATPRRGRRFAASTTSIAAGVSSSASTRGTRGVVDGGGESPRSTRGGHSNRPLAIRARRAEVDERAREMERALARGDVERILHELFRGGSGMRFPADADRRAEEEDEDETFADDGSQDEGFTESDSENENEIDSASRERGSRGWTSAFSLPRALEAMLTASRLDSMSYEDLLERFGPGAPEPPVAPIDLVRRMPTSVVAASDVRADRCCVCLESYAAGDETKSLRGCGHEFHKKCIDRWLTRERNACPVCRGTGVESTSEKDPSCGCEMKTRGT